MLELAKPFIKPLSILLIASSGILGLTSCSSDSSLFEEEVKIEFSNKDSIPAPDVTYMEAETIAATPEIRIPIDGHLSIGKAGIGDFLLWQGVSSDESIAKFYPATFENNISSTAYFKGLKAGSVEITLTNEGTGEVIKTILIVE